MEDNLAVRIDHIQPHATLDPSFSPQPKIESGLRKIKATIIHKVERTQDVLWIGFKNEGDLSVFQVLQENNTAQLMLNAVDAGVTDSADSILVADSNGSVSRQLLLLAPPPKDFRHRSIWTEKFAAQVQHIHPKSLGVYFDEVFLKKMWFHDESKDVENHLLQDLLISFILNISVIEELTEILFLLGRGSYNHLLNGLTMSRAELEKNGIDLDIWH